MEKLLFYARNSRPITDITSKEPTNEATESSITRSERDEWYGHTEIIVERWRRPIRFDWRISRRSTKRTVKILAPDTESGIEERRGVASAEQNGNRTENSWIKRYGRRCKRRFSTSPSRLRSLLQLLSLLSRFPDNVDSSRLDSAGLIDGSLNVVRGASRMVAGNFLFPETEPSTPHPPSSPHSRDK